jgi:DNA repair protein RecO (recombination protein O)
MIHKTRGLVLRSVKYGETSLVVTVFTELFGQQAYMVSGVRKMGARGGTKAGLYQPGSLLEMVVYHGGQQNLHRIRECSWLHIYRNLYEDVRKNTVAMFMVELLQKCLRQPEPNPSLFYFTEDALKHLDEAGPLVTANFPIYYAVHLSHFFGFRMQESQEEKHDILDLREGEFQYEVPGHREWAGADVSQPLNLFLKALHPDSLLDIQLNRVQRRKILETILRYYKLHSAEFGDMRSLPVLQALMD